MLTPDPVQDYYTLHAAPVATGIPAIEIDHQGVVFDIEIAGDTLYWVRKVGDWLTLESYVPDTQSLSTVSAFDQQPGSDNANAVAIGGGYAYVSVTTNEVWRIGLPPLAPSPTVILSPGVMVRDLAADGTWLYYASEAEIGRLDASPGNCCTPEQLSPTAGEAYRVLIDESNVYWFELEDGVSPTVAYGPADIYRVPLAGGTVEPVVAGFEGIVEMTQTADFIYWYQLVDGAPGGIWKLAK